MVTRHGWSVVQYVVWGVGVATGLKAQKIGPTDSDTTASGFGSKLGHVLSLTQKMRSDVIHLQD